MVLPLCLSCMTGPVAAVPRPVGDVSGLVVAHSLVYGSKGWSAGIQPLECFVFPGTGKTIITANNVGIRTTAAACPPAAGDG